MNCKVLDVEYELNQLSNCNNYSFLCKIIINNFMNFFGILLFIYRFWYRDDRGFFTFNINQTFSRITFLCEVKIEFFSIHINTKIDIKNIQIYFAAFIRTRKSILLQFNKKWFNVSIPSRFQRVYDTFWILHGERIYSCAPHKTYYNNYIIKFKNLNEGMA